MQTRPPEGDERKQESPDDTSATRLLEFLEFFAFLEQRARSTIVQLRDDSGTALGVVVLSESRICFARCPARRRKEERDRLHLGAERSLLNAFFERGEAERHRATPSIKTASPVLVEKIRGALKNLITKELWQMIQCSKGRMRARWRPLPEPVDPRLSFAPLEIYEALASHCALPSSDRASRFFEDGETVDAMVILAVRNSTPGLTPIRTRGFCQSSLVDVVRTVRSLPPSLERPDLATDNSPASVFIAGKGAAWKCVFGEVGICVQRVPLGSAKTFPAEEASRGQERS